MQDWMQMTSIPNSTVIDKNKDGSVPVVLTEFINMTINNSNTGQETQ